MRLRIMVIAASLCIAGPVLAQTPSTGTPQGPAAARHRSATPARPAQDAQGGAQAAPTKVDPAKEAAIRHLMDITETSKLGNNVAAYISNQVRTVMSHSIDPNTLPKFMDSFNQKFAVSAPTDRVTDAMVPIYDRAFTMEQIHGLVQFYESPLGQHVVKVLPQVLQASQDAAAKMDQEAALNVLRGMSSDYPQLKNMLPPDKSESAPEGGAAPAAPEKAPAPQPAPASPKQ
jgi:uncharacterized protein